MDAIVNYIKSKGYNMINTTNQFNLNTYIKMIKEPYVDKTIYYFIPRTPFTKMFIKKITNSDSPNIILIYYKDEYLYLDWITYANTYKIAIDNFFNKDNTTCPICCEDNGKLQYCDKCAYRLCNKCAINLINVNNEIKCPQCRSILGCTTVLKGK